MNVLLDDDGMKDRSVVARASIGDIDGLEVLKQRVNVDENGMDHWLIINLDVMDAEFFFQKTRLINIFSIFLYHKYIKLQCLIYLFAGMSH